MVYSLCQFKSVLNGLGYKLEPTGTDGHYDNVLDCYTQAAIQEFQLHHELPVTGEVDCPTQEKARQLIRNLQHSLNLTIAADLPVNEFYGAHTCKAVQLFQQKYGLPVTGIAEITVRRKLNEEAKRLLRHHLSPTAETLEPA